MSALLRRSSRAVAGVGTVVAVIRTDEGSEDRPFLRFVLRIEADGIATYDASAAADLPAAVARMLRPGVRLAVRVDPADLDAPRVDLSRVWVHPSTQVIA